MKSSSRISKILKHMEVENHKEWLGAHAHAFEFINHLLQEEEDRVSKEMYKESDYDSPNWQLLKADQAGQRRIINKLLKLFKE